MGKTILAVALCAGALATAPAAAAGPASLLDELSTSNFSLPGKTSDQMVAAGNEICGHLNTGRSTSDEIDILDQKYGNTNGFLFVSAAIVHLCPEFSQSLHQYPGWQTRARTYTASDAPRDTQRIDR